MGVNKFGDMSTGVLTAWRQDHSAVAVSGGVALRSTVSSSLVAASGTGTMPSGSVITLSASYSAITGILP